MKSRDCANHGRMVVHRCPCAYHPANQSPETQMRSKVQNSMSKYRTNDVGGAAEQSVIGLAVGTKVGGLLLAGALGAIVAMALTPPKTRFELMGMLAASFASSLFVGPLVIEYLNLTHYGFQAQLGICFMVAAPAWLGWCVVSRQFERWRKARNPIGTIRRDTKR